MLRMTNFKMINLKLLSIGYLLTIIFLFLYSFTQVDLSLTLSQWSVWQVVQKFFQHIGYFDRPLSTVLYISILILLFVFYNTYLFLASKNEINKKQIWVLIIASAVILSFSYNAFSYDLFNYIFDAKIVTYYHQSPYIHKALDYQGDPMLTFMHWTHRYYPYGPFWLVLTVPLSFIGFNFFLPTFFLFKFLASLSYLGTAYFISKILNKISAKTEIFGLIFFALNPLVIIEGLVSAHNEIPMMFFALFSLFLFLKRKIFSSLILIFLSIGIKFTTVFLLPVYIFSYFMQKNKKTISEDIIFSLIIFLMFVSVVVASIRTNFQPWYLLFVLPFAALIGRKYYIFIPSVTLSLFALLQYTPFLFKGDWNHPVPVILFWLTAGGIILSIAVTGAVYALNNIVRARKK